MYRPNVSMIIFRKGDGKFLLVHKPREHHAWQFPQGGMDPGEDMVAAAKRELKEELGTDKFKGFQISKHIFFYEFPAGYDREGKYIGQKQSYIFVEFTGEDEDIKLNEEELDQHQWLYQNELCEYIDSPRYLEKINQVIAEFQELL